jgi:hypothetical protein
MQPNSLESETKKLTGPVRDKPSFLGRAGLCFSVAGLFGPVIASFVTYFEHLAIFDTIILSVPILLNLLSIPGSLIGLVALYSNRARRAAFWGFLLGLVGMAFLPTMLMPWIMRH